MQESIAMEEALQELDYIAQEIGLLGIEGKTKCVRVNKKALNYCKQITVGGNGFERDRFPYLGSVINCGSSLSVEILCIKRINYV